MNPVIPDARVLVVSGKGGVGKTTVAAALAVAEGAAGRRVLLAELEDREAFAPLFGRERLTYAEQRLAPGVSGMTIEADEALVEYLQLFYKIPRFSRALIRSRAVEFATHTAPGLKDILLIGKVKSAEGQHERYDRIVVDAPPTGRLPRFLDAPRAIVELVGAGPIRRQAKGVREMVEDAERLQVILVTLAEEMPVQETIEAIETLTKMGIAVGPVVVNGLWEDLPALASVTRGDLAAAARAASLPLTDDDVTTVFEAADAHRSRVASQRESVEELRAAIDQPLFELPHRPGGIAGVEDLASLGAILRGGA